MSEISVIVPVYNVEKYLKRCVDSILNQSYKDFELILVDDGSKDSSGKICDEYGQTDSRVKVIHKKNGGVSAARNTGLKFATGEYIMFVDSDDTILETFFEQAIFSIKKENVDMYISGITMLNYTEDKFVDSQDYTIKNSEKMTVKELLETCNVNYPMIDICGPCCKLYKSSVIKEKSILFNEEMSLGEDTAFNLNYLESVNTVYFSKSIFYLYFRQNSESLFSKFHKEIYENHVYIYNEFRDLMKYKKCSKESLEHFENLYCELIIGCIHSFFKTDMTSKKDRMELLKKIRNNKYVYNSNYSGNSKNKLIITLIKKKCYFILYIMFSAYYRK